MATVVTPHWVNQSASACRSAVKALNSRTETTSRPSGTATRWRSEPMSMPAAFTLMCRKWRGRSATVNSLALADCFFAWGEMILFSLSGVTENGPSRLWAQGCEIAASSLSGSHPLSRMSTSPVAKALTPETKLLHGQDAPMVNRPSRPTTWLHHSFTCRARYRKEFHLGKRSSRRRTAELLRSFGVKKRPPGYKHLAPLGRSHNQCSV